MGPVTPRFCPACWETRGSGPPSTGNEGATRLVQAGLQGLISRGLHVGVQDTWGLTPHDPKGSLVADLEPGMGSTWKLGAHTLPGGCRTLCLFILRQSFLRLVNLETGQTYEKLKKNKNSIVSLHVLFTGLYKLM